MKTEKQKIARAAAIVALKNYGLETFIPDDASDTRYDWSEDAGSEICQIGAHLIESDSMEDSFMEEAVGWQKTIERDGLEAFCNQPHNAKCKHLQAILNA